MLIIQTYIHNINHKDESDFIYRGMWYTKMNNGRMWDVGKRDAIHSQWTPHSTPTRESKCN